MTLEQARTELRRQQAHLWNGSGGRFLDFYRVLRDAGGEEPEKARQMIRERQAPWRANSEELLRLDVAIRELERLAEARARKDGEDDRARTET